MAKYDDPRDWEAQAAYMRRLEAQNRLDELTRKGMSQELRDARDAYLDTIKFADIKMPVPPLPSGEPKMTVQQSVDQQLQAKLSERRVEREVARRLAIVDSYGEDVYPVGTVITFEKKFPTTKDTLYSYAVIKAATDKWFVTGNTLAGPQLTWDALVEFLVSGPFPVTSVTVKAEGGTVFPAPKEETK